MSWQRAPHRGWWWSLMAIMPFMAQAEPDPTLSSRSIISLPLVPRQEVLRRQLQTTAFESAVFRSAGQHYVDVYVGSPDPQLRTLVVDTGSYLNAFTCTECVNCGKRQNPVFEHEKSTTFQKTSYGACNLGTFDFTENECSYAVPYFDGSNWTGYEATDRASLSADFAPSATFTLDFICQRTLSGNFVNATTDGILGMGVASTSFWNQLYEANLTSSYSFSFCSSASQELAFEGNRTVEGVLTLGGNDERLHTSPLVFSINATNVNKTAEETADEGDNYFHVSVRQVYLGGNEAKDSSDLIPIFANTTLQALLKKVSLNSTIVDTGTAATTVPSEWYDAINEAWMEKTGLFFDPYLALTEADMKKTIQYFPTFFFQLVGDASQNYSTTRATSDKPPVLASEYGLDPPNDVIIPLPPTGYIQRLGEYNDITYYGPQFNYAKSSLIILGENFIAGHDVFFDYSSDSIGWARSDCDFSRTQPTPAPTESPSMPRRKRKSAFISPSHCGSLFEYNICPL